ncbi:MAG TPA: hypothetical protein VJY39_12810 [Acidisphaera sp.]|nr:hypothetical protein [Acidisphaera sp.]
MRISQRGLTLCTTLALLGAAPAVHADSLRPIDGMQADLGDVSVYAYYVDTPHGFHLVATAQTMAAEPTVLRFEAVLQPGQDATISVPRAVGQPPVRLVFHRRGDVIEFDHPDVQTD